MKKLNLGLAILGVVIFSNSNAQEKTPRVRISEFHLQTGFQYYPAETTSLEDFQKLAPNSILLKEDLPSYNSIGYYNGRGNFSSVQLGLTFKNHPNALLRVGISTMGVSGLQNSYSKQDYFPYDTLTSSATGEQTFIDSVSSQSYFMNHSSRQIRLDAALIFRTDASARWSLFAGIGASLGVNYNATTYISYYRNSYINSQNDNSYNYGYSNNGSEKTESFTTKNYLTTTAYIPMGVDFRIGKNKVFWKRLHLYYEIKPSISMTQIPALRTITTVNMTQALGLKVSF
jgi:hypothetical protein